LFATVRGTALLRSNFIVDLLDQRPLLVEFCFESRNFVLLLPAVDFNWPIVSCDALLVPRFAITKNRRKACRRQCLAVFTLMTLELGLVPLPL
jgi:hypothetical protein